MKKMSIETAVGVFMIVGFVCVGYLTLTLGELELFAGDNYPLYARFQDISGLKDGAVVEMAGVQIGKIDKISLDAEREVALVKLMIQGGISLTDDSIASVKTSGLIGDKYVKITPGGSPVELEPGDFINETESAFDLESLIGKYVFGSAGKDDQ